MSELLEELKQLESESKKAARSNHHRAYFVAILAVIGSISASICASIEGVPAWVVSIAAIIPAAVAATKSKLQFETKSQWFWSRTHELGRLRRNLEFEGGKEEEISAELSRFESEIDESWVKFGGGQDL